MMKISIFPHLYSVNADLSVKFYVEELSLFNISTDYGMGTYLLFANDDPSMGLMIVNGEAVSNSQRPAFTIGVSEIEPLFQRLRNFEFLTGAELLTKRALFDYPAGKSMTLRDPGGNVFIIEQPYAA
ncbi:VOC family protein [Paracidovorax avenae]|uniref:VOC family protein n=1 Tax=Paracidovorax avenae TaxID=80867 RepID=UPI001AD84158|nr:hypothetical protein [Paracidovorax avenae]